MRNLWFLLAVVLVVGALAASAQGQLTGHYPLGVEGIKAATVPPPGLYLRNYLLFYDANVWRDRSGDNAGVGLDLNVFAYAPRLIWITEETLFGANYGMSVLLPLMCTDMEMRTFDYKTHDFSLGDLYVEPVILSWHGERWDIGTGAGVWLPTGNRKRDNPATPGKDFYTAMFTFGGTLYLDEEKTWSLSGLNRYEIHSRMRDEDVRAGSNWVLEWGLAKMFMPGVDVGVVGYHQWQLTSDKGSDVTWDRSVHDRVAAIGPEVSVFVPDLMTNISFRWLWEYSAVDRPEGQTAVLTVTKIF